MAYSAKILADSLAPCGSRLTTWELTFPRIVHAEFMTHREFSRNAASSRAIPNEKFIERVEKDPFIPIYWGKNQKGMQAAEELSPAEQERATRAWLAARDTAVVNARYLAKIGAHKQIVNRLLEPWMWITVICSATNFSNWFHLRCHPDAQPEIRRIADMMRNLYYTSAPRCLDAGEWHLPLVGLDDEIGLEQTDLAAHLCKVSVGRCARVSYLTHDGKRDSQADVDLHDRLLESGHWSPFEHVASAMATRDRSGNFEGFRQFRKTFTDEYVSTYAYEPAMREMQEV